MGKLLTAHELAKELNLSVETVWRYTRQKKIPVIFLGKKQYRYEKGRVLAALEKGDALVKEDTFQNYNKEDFTYEDYLKLKDVPGYRHEVLDGVLVREPSPSFRHQKAVGKLFRRLADYFDEFDPGGEIVFSPMDVTLSEKIVIQPDIMFISGDRKDIIKDERIDGACDLIVEIVSPKYRRKDYIEKREIYRKAGVLHYWIVDPEEDFMEAYKLVENHYTLIATGDKEGEFTHPDFPGLEIDLEKVFDRS